MSDAPVCYRRFALEDQKLAIYKVAYGGMLIFNIYTLVVVAFGLAVAALRYCRPTSSNSSVSSWS